MYLRTCMQHPVTHRQELLHLILEPYSEGEALQPRVQSSNVAHLTDMNELAHNSVWMSVYYVQLDIFLYVRICP